MNNYHVEKLSNKIKLIHPGMDYLLNRINFNQYFSLSKYSPEWWITLKVVMENCRNKNKLRDYTYLAKNMIYAWEVLRKKGKTWGFYEEYTENILKAFGEEVDGLLTGVGFCGSFSGRVKDDIFIQGSTKHRKSMVEAVHTIYNKKLTLYNTSFWKRWAVTGELNDFLTKIERPITIVGPEYLDCTLKHYPVKIANFIGIDSTHAMKYIPEYEEKIVSSHNENDNMVYIVQGGGTMIYLVNKLHKKLKNKCIMDVGTSINIYSWKESRKPKSKLYNIDLLDWLKNKPAWIN